MLFSAENARGVIQLARDSVSSWRGPSRPLDWHVDAGGDAILLLHGLAGSPRMLAPMRNYLHRELERPALDIALGVGLGDIRDMAIRVHDQLAQRDIRHCDVIGYSMGGLVAAYLAKCLDQGRCIRRVVTLGTPFRGVPCLTDWRGLLARWCRSADQMRAGSAFLEQLVRIPPPARTHFLSIAGAADTIVPPESAHLDGDGCRNLVVPGIYHWSLPTSRRVFRCVKEVLAAEQGAWPTPHLEAAPPVRLRYPESTSTPSVGFGQVQPAR